MTGALALFGHFQKIVSRHALFFLIFLVPTRAVADFFVHNWEDSHQPESNWVLGGDAFYYYSMSNFDSNRNRVVPMGFNSYGRFENDYFAAYGLTGSWTFFARADWVRIDVNANSAVESFPGTAYGFGDQTLAGNYRAYESSSSGASLDFQLQADLPAYNNNQSAQNQTPFLGDDSIDLTVGAFFGIPISLGAAQEISIKAGTGLTLRTAGFSRAIPWNVEGRYQPQSLESPGIVASVALGGFQSLQSDTTPTLASGISGSQGAGGSFIVNAINPSIVNAMEKGGYRFSSCTEVEAFLSQSILGSNAPNGFLAGLEVQLRFSPQASQPNPTQATPSQPAPTETPAAPPQAPVESHEGTPTPWFSSYGLEAKVLRVEDRMNLIKISKGSHDGVAVGDLFDIFSRNPDGSPGSSVARARVTHVHVDRAVLKVEEYFSQTWVEEGFTARRLVR